MKIVHFCLSCFYIDNYSYQENILPIMNAKNGHEVIIVASTETFLENCKIGYTNSGNYFTNEGIKLYRLDYSKILPSFIMRKVRIYNGVNEILNNFNPDIIFFHGLAAFELINITNYVKKNRNTKLFLDSHEDQNNSARNPISKYILHKGLYRFVIKKTRKYFSKVYYVSFEVKNFIKENYNINENIEYLPLGGELYSDNVYLEKRNLFRKLHNLSTDELIYFHSGKMGKSKKTIELLRAYISSNTEKKLFIAGSVSKDIENEFISLVKENRNITYLGWQDSEALSNAFCASDIYLQPGSQSVSMQQAICSRNVVALYPYPSHDYLLNDFYIKLRNGNDIYSLFKNVDNNNLNLENLRSESYKIATEFLDYNMQSNKYL